MDNFFYKYPDIITDADNFSLDIYKKYEFRELQSDESGGLLRHQKIVSRFMNGHTDYKSLLIYHGLGTGKCVLPNSRIFIKGEKKITMQELWDKYFTINHLIPDINYPEEWLFITVPLYTKSIDDQGNVCNGKITKLFRQYVNENVITIVCRGLITNQTTRLTMTHNHRILLANSNTYSNKFSVGDIIKGEDENYLIESSLEYEYKGLVYDVEVEQHHNYLVENLYTHNTCSSIAISEKLHQTKNIRKTMVITKGGALEKQYIEQLVNVCVEPKNKYKHPEHEQLNQRTQQIRSKKIYGRFYEFSTFIKFAKRINKIRKQSSSEKEFVEKINILFDRYLFIIDEAHNIRPNFDKVINVYQTFHEFFHKLQDKRILLLTGTPIKDSVVEIAYLMNMILPEDKQLPTGAQFINKYIEPETHTFKLGELQQLKKQFIGYVSFFRSNFEDIKQVFMGESGIGTLSFFKVVPVNMSSIQSEGYIRALIDDKHKKGIFSNSRQASLMVDQNGNWGTKLQIKGILDHLKTLKTNQEKIQYIAQYSTKYAALLMNILEHPNDNIFVYNTFVKGSGLLVFAKFMDALGFTRSPRGGEKTKNKNRYAVITNEMTNPLRTMSIINTFNSPNNVHGDYIRVIIGSKITSEGLTFKNVKHIHILTPFWNFTDIEQAIARTIRLYSHKALINLGEKPIVKIYMYTAIPKTENNHQQLDVGWDDDDNMDDLEKQLEEELAMEMDVDDEIENLGKQMENLEIDSDEEKMTQLEKELEMEFEDSDDEKLAQLEKELEMEFDSDSEDEKPKKKIPKNMYKDLGLDSDSDSDDDDYDEEEDDKKLAQLEEEIGTEFDEGQTQYVNDTVVEKVLSVEKTEQIAENLKKNLYSIDLYMYSISEKKDYQTKVIERILKEISFDCFLNSKNNNNVNGIDGSRECDYTSCIIKCNAKGTDDTITFDSYNILYDDTYRTTIQNSIELYFSLHSGYTTISELTKWCQDRNSNVLEFQVKNVLSDMILHSKYIKNNMGIDNLINYANDDNIYLVYSQNIFDNFYFKNHWVQMNTTLDNFISNYLDAKDIVIVKRIIENTNDNEKWALLQQLTSQHIDELIKTAITSNSDTEFRKWILKTFDTLIVSNDKHWFVLRNVLSPLKYDGEKWTQFTSVNSPNDIDEVNELIRKRFGQPPLEYYAIHNVTTKSLLLRSTESLAIMRKGKGMECTSFKPGDLLTKIIIPANIEIPGNTNINDNKLKDKVHKIFTHDELAKFTPKQIQTIFNTFSSNKIDICKHLLEWFTENKKLQITF